MPGWGHNSFHGSQEGCSWPSPAPSPVPEGGNVILIKPGLNSQPWVPRFPGNGFLWLLRYIMETDNLKAIRMAIIKKKDNKY